jgi:hypothetical protein
MNFTEKPIINGWLLISKHDRYPGFYGGGYSNSYPLYEQIWIKWQKKTKAVWYSGIIIETKNDTMYHVQYDDGDKKWYNKDIITYSISRDNPNSTS